MLEAPEKDFIFLVPLKNFFSFILNWFPFYIKFISIPITPTESVYNLIVNQPQYLVLFPICDVWDVPNDEIKKKQQKEDDDDDEVRSKMRMWKKVEIHLKVTCEHIKINPFPLFQITQSSTCVSSFASSPFSLRVFFYSSYQTTTDLCLCMSHLTHSFMPQNI